VSTLERVRAELLDDNGPRPVFLLGAGASVKSGVPTAAGFAQMIARWAYLREHGRSEHDQTIHRSDWLPWLKTLSWYEERLPPESQYPTLVEKLLTPREARMQFFLERVRAAPAPSVGYEALAGLIAKGWVRSVLTTNFDDLVERACVANPQALVTTIRSEGEAGNISTAPRYAQLVYLHGTVEHYTDLNLASETRELGRPLVDALVPLLRDAPLIVMGYRGAEHSIMRSLLIDRVEECNRFRHGIYWCVRPGSSLSPLVEELRDAVEGNLLEVEIPGFDEALSQLDDAADHRAKTAAPDELSPLPSDELLPSGFGMEALDWETARSRIPACAERLDLTGSFESDSALRDLLLRLNLAMESDGDVVPTVAGARLLGKDGSAEVVLVWPTGERTFRGNVLQLVDDVREALTEMNAPYRLKGPRSVDVRAFEPLALKELLVNSLVHRRYDVDAPVRIAVSEDAIAFVSPGGVVESINPEQLGRTDVKAYRNQVLANVLFGTGDMDKLGSGLVDVRRWAQEAGADVEFIVSGTNDEFTAVLGARPDRPDAPGRPAEATGSYDVFYGNALPVRLSTGTVQVAPCSRTDRRQIWDRHPGKPTPPFVLRGGNLITLDSLRNPRSPLVAEVDGPAESFALPDYLAVPDGDRHVVQLLNESLGRHASDRGFVVDWKQRRLWYPRSEDGDGTVQVTYTGRVKQSTRTVVKVRKRTDGEVAFFEHSALAWQFRFLGGEWFLFLLPGWAFTRDGVDHHLPPKKVTSLSTRRAARDYNANVSAHLFFWAHALCGGDREVILADGGESVVLDAHPLTAHLAGMPATPGNWDPEDGSTTGEEEDLEELEDLEDLDDDDDDDDDGADA
jgi:NAD-dependent SIR2 family protein deacetylase